MFATSKIGRRLEGGFLAGLFGGVVLSVFLVFTSLLQSTGVWIPLKAASAPFFGERALAPGFELGVVLVGVLGHFAVAVTWGMLFGLAFYGASKAGALFFAALWGLVVWVGMYHMLLPLLGLSALVHAVPVELAILQHVVFGLAVGFGFLPTQQLQRDCFETTQTSSEGTDEHMRDGAQQE